MATYLQGVQDYIPQIQPAQPDFNFYNTVLQTKQNQYDTNPEASPAPTAEGPEDKGAKCEASQITSCARQPI